MAATPTAERQSHRLLPPQNQTDSGVQREAALLSQRLADQAQTQVQVQVQMQVQTQMSIGCGTCRWS